MKKLLKNVYHDCVRDVEPGVQTFGLYVCRYPCPKTKKKLSTLSIMNQHGDWSPKLKDAVSNLLPKAHVEWKQDGRTYSVSIARADVRNFPGDSITVYPEKIRVTTGVPE